MALTLERESYVGENRSFQVWMVSVIMKQTEFPEFIKNN